MAGYTAALLWIGIITITAVMIGIYGTIEEITILKEEEREDENTTPNKVEELKDETNL